jgi:hypothetical protein
MQGRHLLLVMRVMLLPHAHEAAVPPDLARVVPPPFLVCWPGRFPSSPPCDVPLYIVCGAQPGTPAGCLDQPAAFPTRTSEEAGYTAPLRGMVVVAVSKLVPHL